MALSNRQYAAFTNALSTLPAFKAFAEGYVAMASNLTVSRTNATARGLRPPRGVVVEKIAVRGDFPGTRAGRRAQDAAFTQFIAQFRTPRNMSLAAMNTLKCQAFDMGRRQARGDFAQHSFVRDGQFVTTGTIEDQVQSIRCPYRTLASDIRGLRGLGDLDPTASLEGDLTLAAEDPAEVVIVDSTTTTPSMGFSTSTLLIGGGVALLLIGLLATSASSN